MEVVMNKLSKFSPLGVWHYTVGVHLPSIVSDGEIRVATAFVSDHELPVVWCSTNPHWEQTANKAFQKSDGTVRCLSREETETLGRGLARIQIKPRAAPYTWKDFVARSGISKKLARAFPILYSGVSVSNL
jgi:hypothetical protein